MENQITENKLGASRRKKIYYVALSWALVGMLIFGTVIAVLLLTQTFPVITAAKLASTSCTSGGTPLTANVTFYIVGQVSYIRFTCTADSMGYSTQGGIQATPTFTLDSQFSELWSYRSTTGSGGTCSAGTGAWQMTTGSPHTFPSGASIGWDYCVKIPNTSTTDSATFTVAWSA